jgi:hypothetical protein
MRNRGTILTVVLVFSFCETMMGASSKLNSSDAVRALGVSEYVLNRASQLTTIDLLRGTAKVATVATALTVDGTRVISIDRADTSEHLQVYWDGRRVKFETGDGVLHSIDMDLETGELIGSQVALELWQKHSASVQLAVAVTADVLSRTSRLHIHSEMMSEGPPSTIDIYEPAWWMWWDAYYGTGGSWDSWKTSQVECFGPTVRGSVAGIGLTRSGICAAAKDDANTKCWNQYCTGCCQLEACDALCYSGTDYLCATAGMTGTSCSIRQ